MEYEINAQGQKLGRVASQAASFLMGKNRADFVRNKIPAIKVKISNASKLDITKRKMGAKMYKSYSGYPGGLNEQTMKKVVGDKGFKEALRKAVHGMLPGNKLRPEMMKNLIISE